MQMTPTPQAYKRMIRLTFFSGLFVGALAVMFVMLINDNEFKHWGRFLLDDPLVTNVLLPALSSAAFGIVWILEWRRHALSIQFPTLRPGKRVSAQENTYWSLAYGVVYLGLAVVQVFRNSIRLGYLPLELAVY